MSDTTETPRMTGTVKWFNNKSGFGFITVCDEGEFNGKDIFVHYSSINVSNTQYKYLVQGEYVDFTLVHIESDKHEYQAIDVTGIKRGPIMCETRQQNPPRRMNDEYHERRPRTARTASPPSSSSNENLGFIPVERRRNNSNRENPTRRGASSRPR
jgi:CspA family cold shock protein